MYIYIYYIYIYVFEFFFLCCHVGTLCKTNPRHVLSTNIVPQWCKGHIFYQSYLPSNETHIRPTNRFEVCRKIWSPQTETKVFLCSNSGFPFPPCYQKLFLTHEKSKGSWLSGEKTLEEMRSITKTPTKTPMAMASWRRFSIVQQ